MSHKISKTSFESNNKLIKDYNMNKRSFSITSLLRLTKIQVRLLCVFVLLSIIPIAITGFMSYNLSKEAIINKVNLYSSEFIKQFSTNIHTEVDKVLNINKDIVLSDELQSYISKIRDSSDSDRLKLRRKIEELIMKKLSISKSISKISMHFIDNSVIEIGNKGSQNYDFASIFSDLQSKVESTEGQYLFSIVLIVKLI